MKGELTAVIEPAPEGGFWAICLEIPGANGQGETVEEARTDLQAAIKLLLEDREAGLLPPDAVLIPSQAASKASTTTLITTNSCSATPRPR
jgi:predicted RNase H-like HicB family nuclease